MQNKYFATGCDRYLHFLSRLSCKILKGGHFEFLIYPQKSFKIFYDPDKPTIYVFVSALDPSRYIVGHKQMPLTFVNNSKRKFSILAMGC